MCYRSILPAEQPQPRTCTSLSLKMTANGQPVLRAATTLTGIPCSTYWVVFAVFTDLIFLVSRSILWSAP